MVRVGTAKMQMDNVPRVLVTGACGFLGGHLCRRFGVESYDVVGTTRSDCAVPSKLKTVRLDLCDHTSVSAAVENTRPQIIVHAAAVCRPDVCEERPSLAFAVNVLGTKALASAARSFGARFVFVSSDFVFDGDEGPYSESDLPEPKSVYGHTKLEAEKIVQKHVLNYAIIRLSLLFGMGTIKHMSMSDHLITALSSGQGVTAHTDEYRTPLHVSDAVDGIIRLALSDHSGVVVHLAGDERLSRYSFAYRLQSHLRASNAQIIGTRIDEGLGRAYRGKECTLDCTKAHLLLGFKPQSIEKGLRRTIAEWRGTS